MLVLSLLALTADPEALEQAQQCRAHLEIMIEDAARAGVHVAGPTWFIRDWWAEKAGAVGAHVGDGADQAEMAARKAALGGWSKTDPDAFAADRQTCIDEAIDAGAVPGMGPA